MDRGQMRGELPFPQIYVNDHVQIPARQHHRRPFGQAGSLPKPGNPPMFYLMQQVFPDKKPMSFPVSTFALFTTLARTYRYESRIAEPWAVPLLCIYRLLRSSILPHVAAPSNSSPAHKVISCPLD